MRLADKIATMARRGAPLPYDAEVEYLESDAAYQRTYIITDIIADNETGFKVAYQLTDSTDVNNGIVGRGGYVNTDRFFVSISNSSFDMMFAWNSAITVNSVEINRTDIYVSELNFRNSRVMRLSNSESGQLWSRSISSALKDSNAGIGIFCENNNGNPLTGNCRIYGVEVSQGETVTHDFIPVRVGPRENCVGYMFDRLNPTGGPNGNGLYGNLGTVAFLVGPDKA